MGDYNAREEVVSSLEAKIKITPHKGTNDGLHEVVSLCDGLMDIPSDPKWNAAGGSDHFHGDKGADVADDLFPFLIQFPGPEAIVLIIMLSL